MYFEKEILVKILPKSTNGLYSKIRALLKFTFLSETAQLLTNKKPHVLTQTHL